MIKKINYKLSASDIYTSQIEIKSLPRYINYLLLENFIGTINIGEKKISDYDLYKKIKPKLKPFKRKNLIKKLKFNIAKDASLNTSKFKKIKKNMNKLPLEIVVPIYNEGKKLLHF